MANKQARMAKAVADLDRAEVKLLRAVNKWQKARATVRRLGAKLDRESLEGLPGEMDVRKMPIKPRPWPGRNRHRPGELIRKGS